MLVLDPSKRPVSEETFIINQVSEEEEEDSRVLFSFNVD